LKNISGKDFARLLEKHGWELKRVTGSHYVYAKSGNSDALRINSRGIQVTDSLRHTVEKTVSR
jgi:hypothetical protein